jgi:hypothetical protein
MLERRTPIDSRIERQIATGLIISTRFIQELKPILKENSLQLPYVQIIAGWCLDFYENHKTAPGRNIQDIFIEHRKLDLNDDTADLIEDFLTSISDEYERKDETFNVDYYIKKAELHLRSVSLDNLSKNIKKAVVGGRIEEAEALAKGYERITRIRAQGVDPIFDTKFCVSLFDENSGDKLFSLPGALGKAVGPLERGWLYAIVGSAKVGKTWWLMLIALRALFSGLNVLFLSLEMSEKQMGRRIHHYINSLPTRKWAGELLIPVFDCEKNQKGTCNLSQRISNIDLTTKEGMITSFDLQPFNYRPCTACMNTREFACSSWYKKTNKEELTLQQVLKKKEALKRSAMIRGARFRLIEQPSGKYTMSEFRSHLYNLENYENFVPDVIVTDYADKFKSENRDYRNGLNEIWEGHKGLAQEKNCLVVTASQSNTARSGKDIGQGSFAEDIRKLNLVDGAMGLNMTPQEKKMGVSRGLIMANRFDDFSLISQVKILHQLKVGRPYLDSYVDLKSFSK